MLRGTCTQLHHEHQLPPFLQADLATVINALLIAYSYALYLRMSLKMAWKLNTESDGPAPCRSLLPWLHYINSFPSLGDYEYVFMVLATMLKASQRWRPEYLEDCLLPHGPACTLPPSSENLLSILTPGQT